MKKSSEFLLIIIGTYFLFRIGQAIAYEERGYIAYGGEYILLLTPPLYIAILDTVHDFLKTLTEIRQEEEDEG